MKKRVSLSSALLAASGRGVSSSEKRTEPEHATTSPASLGSTSREGKKAIAGFFDPVVSKQLKQIGLERDMDIQDLMREAFNDLFEKYGRSRIA